MCNYTGYIKMTQEERWKTYGSWLKVNGKEMTVLEAIIYGKRD